jgi:hypothetical protein
MKRFLNKVQSEIYVEPVSKGDYESTKKFKISNLSGKTLVDNELFIGTYDNKDYLFIYKDDNNIYSLSHDDNTLDFLIFANSDLSTAIDDIVIPDPDGPIPTIEHDSRPEVVNNE